MVYLTVPQAPMYHQMTLEEFLFGNEVSTMLCDNRANTRTYEREYLTPYIQTKLGFRTDVLIRALADFNRQTAELREKPRHDLYETFHIPKRSGGLRRIDAPKPELMDALRRLKTIFETDFRASYHTAAFAYVKHRSTIDAVKRHQSNESRWFGKYDLHDFFGSTTPDFLMHMLGMIYPFSELMHTDAGHSELETALDLAFLDGGLPQGTPLSPLLTNLMMIPVDYKLAQGFRDLNKQRFIYTRYADDFLVSSRYDFDFRAVEKYIIDTLASFDAPFTINAKKTRYGSSAGSNWNLGVMLNRDNQITVGHKKKKRFEAMLCSFVLDTQNGHPWPLEDIQQLEGYRSYYRMVEGETIDRIVAHVGAKYHADIPKLIKEQMKL